MKKGFLLLVPALILISCSKKNDVKPEVSINGTNYPTVKIGSQTWTAANYNGPGGQNYNRGTVNDPLYGKFYSLDEAMSVSLPAGWRVPTREDAEKLLLFLGAKKDVGGSVTAGDSIATKLKSIPDWKYNDGHNDTGFNAYPAGSSYALKGELAEFWTSTTMFIGVIHAGQYTLSMWDSPPLYSYNDIVQVGIRFNSSDYNTYLFSLRFVKDN